MLSRKDNLRETIKGGHPDRYVNSYEFLQLLYANPYTVRSAMPQKGQLNVKNSWGVTNSFPENTPGVFPVHDEEHIVIKDITRWKEYVKAPEVVYPAEEWAPFVKMAEEVDRDEYFAAVFVAPGIFEQCHHLGELQNTLINFYEEPECMHELIDFLSDWEVKYAEQICKYLKPDAIFHHDDWGSQISSFLSPEMFEEFIEPAYKKIYGYYKEHGVEIIVHHSDSYAANLVPSMIRMGIDIWQGVMSTNNIPELVKNYGGQITFMGGIDNGVVDREDWTKEGVAEAVEKACRENGTKFYIPGTTMGGPESLFPGVYEEVAANIDRMSKIMF